MRRDARIATLAENLGQPGVSVRTLVRMRWIAIAGQLVTLGIVAFYFRYPLPWLPTLAAVAAALLLNVGLASLYQRNTLLVGGEALLHLAFDLVQLGVLLFLTGGLTNPFSILLLVPVTTSATLLSAPATLALLAVALATLATLWLWALPLPWAGELILLPDVYRTGVFLAETLGMLFLAVYAWQLSAAARRRQAALVATEAALEREAKMSALGSLAAAAAHELGGPLGTITLIARELADQLGDDPDFGPDIRLLESEAKRAREILVGIALRAEAEDPFPDLPIAALLEEVVAPYERDGLTIALSLDPSLEQPPFIIRRSPELLYGLANIVSNAARHATARVEVAAEPAGERLLVRVADDGPGFPPALLPRLGEPFLGPSQSGAGGTGLGVFIATTLLERTGGRVRFGNLPDGGAQVDIQWRREHIAANESRRGWSIGDS